MQATDTEAINRIAARNGFSAAAAQALLDALVRGGGGMAQFNHAEFSGPGQWMRGGMTMVSDMFNGGLKARVDALASDLSALLDERPALSRPSSVSSSSFATPDEWGQPSSSGSQNGSRYAVFDAAHRLAIEHEGRLSLYDTLDHRIGGVAQQQGATGTMRFTSQHGLVDVERLPQVSGEGGGRGGPDFGAAPSRSDIPATIEKLADLKAKGILSADQFESKKAELLARI